MKTKNFTPVIFRKFKDGGDVVAIFPTLPYYSTPLLEENTCMSYMHVGQHGAVEYPDINDITVLATPEEYTGLLEELQSIGYEKLEVYKKQPYWMVEERLFGTTWMSDELIAERVIGLV